MLTFFKFSRKKSGVSQGIARDRENEYLVLSAQKGEGYGFCSLP
jgi:hypothetical protein